MRISNIQNFAANAVNMMNKCCGPRKSANNTASQNNLEHSPAMDTVSFGNIGVGDQWGVKGKKGYVDKQLDAYITNLFIDGGHDIIEDLEAIGDCIYFDTRAVNIMDNIYKADLVSFERFQPEAGKDKIKEYNKTLKDAYDDFNKENGYKAGWEKHLHTEEDFRKLAELARYLNLYAYQFSSAEEEERPMFRNW